MTYKDLLVHLDDSKGCARRVNAAVGLAARHGAHLTGVYSMVEIPLLNYIRNQIPPEIQTSIAAEAQTRAEAALSGFRTAVERSAVPHETRIAHALDTTLASVLSMHARYADLLVLGQVAPDERRDCSRRLLEEVVLSSGMKVLIVPYYWEL